MYTIAQEACLCWAGHGLRRKRTGGTVVPQVVAACMRTPIGVGGQKIESFVLKAWVFLLRSLRGTHVARI